MEYEGYETIKLVAKVEARPDMIILTSESSGNDATLDHNVQQTTQWHHHQPYHHLEAACSESTPTWSNMTSEMKQPVSPHGAGTRSPSTSKAQKHTSFDQSTPASPTTMVVPVDHQKLIQRAVKLLKTKCVPVS